MSFMNIFIGIHQCAGANVMIGGSAPVRAVVDAMGHAACVYLNENNQMSVALPCLSLYRGNETIIVFGVSDGALSNLKGKAVVHGAYHNILSKDGVSAMWNGYIGAASSSGSSSVPSVVVDGLKVVGVTPYNLIHPAKRFVFIEKGAGAKDLSEADAVDRYSFYLGFDRRC